MIFKQQAVWGSNGVDIYNDTRVPSQHTYIDSTYNAVPLCYKKKKLNKINKETKLSLRALQCRSLSDVHKYV